MANVATVNVEYIYGQSIQKVRCSTPPIGASLTSRNTHLPSSSTDFLTFLSVLLTSRNTDSPHHFSCFTQTSPILSTTSHMCKHTHTHIHTHSLILALHNYSLCIATTRLDLLFSDQRFRVNHNQHNTTQHNTTQLFSTSLTTDNTHHTISAHSINTNIQDRNQYW